MLDRGEVADTICRNRKSAHFKKLKWHWKGIFDIGKTPALL